MMKKLLVALLEIILIVLVVWFVISILDSVSFADELITAYVLCQPNDYINVRMNPSRHSMIVGYAEVAYSFLTDMVTRNGFVKCYGIGEMGEGWIHKGYVVYDEPVEVNKNGYSISKAKLAARKCIGGKVRKWLHNLDGFKVYWMSDEWCVTSRGFVKTEFVELDGGM